MLDHKRLKWKCRRGMLELDLLLQDFLQHQYAYLSVEQQQCFHLLLDQQDPVLYDWLINQSLVENDTMQKLIIQIRKNYQSKR